MSGDCCVGCGGTGVLFFEGVERISPDGEGTVTCCVVERCDKCCKYPDDAAAMSRARHAVREQHAVDHISRSLREEEGKVQLAESMHRLMQQRKQERARERAATPLCHFVLHPFLGTKHFKDTCPECGWKVVKEEECPKKEPSGSST